MHHDSDDCDCFAPQAPKNEVKTSLRYKNYDHNSFQTHFRQLLKKYKPDVEQVKLALERYPSTRNKFILK